MAEQIEKALFEVLVFKDSSGRKVIDKRYTQKAYSLQFNLKKNEELRREIYSSRIRPEVFVRMSSEELASKELTQWRDSERKRSLMDVVLGEGDEGALIKKTHKGEEVVVGSKDTNSKIEDRSPNQDVKDSPELNESTLAIPVLRSKDLDENLSNLSPTMGHENPITRRDSLEFPGRELSMDDESRTATRSKIMENTTKLLPTERQSPTSSPTTTTPTTTDMTATRKLESWKNVWRRKIERLPNWEGMISFVGVSSCQAKGYHIGGNPIDLRTSLSSLFHIQGRIDRDRAETYLSQLKHSASKDYSIWLILPATEQETSAFTELHQYYRSRDKYAVIDITSMPDLVDFYLMAINENDAELPESVRDRIELDLLPKDEAYMLAIIVIPRSSKDSSKKSSITSSSLSSTDLSNRPSPSTTTTHEIPNPNNYSIPAHLDLEQLSSISASIMHHSFPSHSPYNGYSHANHPYPSYHQQHSQQHQQQHPQQHPQYQHQQQHPQYQHQYQQQHYHLPPSLPSTSSFYPSHYRQTSRPSDPQNFHSTSSYNPPR